MTTAERAGAAAWPAERRVPLDAEASTRRFVRLVRPRGLDVPSAVLMVFAPGTPAAEVERVRRATSELEAQGLPVPRLHAHDARAGWILQEDLGDLSLARALAAGRDVRAAYDEALGWLEPLRAARVTTSPVPPLDGVRMRRELVLCAARLPGGAPPGWDAELDALAERCARAPTALCHRDYHARNLMLHEGRVRWIDHQDALVGPAVYDRVSLAYDPYVDLPDARRDALAGDDEHLVPVALQRLLKAIGTYLGQGRHFAASVAPAARQARRLLERDGPARPVTAAVLARLGAGADG